MLFWLGIQNSVATVVTDYLYNLIEYSPVENVPESARCQSTLIPQLKRMLQPLISVVAKRMKLSSNIAKRKRDQAETNEPCEEDILQLQ